MTNKAWLVGRERDRRRKLVYSAAEAEALAQREAERKTTMVLIQDVDDEVVETIAGFYHNRWVSDHRAQGWRYALDYSASEKTSPMMTDYHELPPAFQARPRATVRAVIAAMAQADVLVTPPSYYSRGASVTAETLNVPEPDMAPRTSPQPMRVVNLPEDASGIREGVAQAFAEITKAAEAGAREQARNEEPFVVRVRTHKGGGATGRAVHVGQRNKPDTRGT